jgi:hypothetical protein
MNGDRPASGSRLLQAALAGLLSVGASGCGSSSPGPGPGDPMITSSSTVEGLTAEGFKALCDARNGTVEELSHCSGLATAAGFSYDIDTQLLSEHTCKGANTCAGWNCVTDDDGQS